MRATNATLALAVLLGCTASAGAEGIQRYAYVVMGKREGGMTLAETDRGIRVDYAFNDRGRGPDLHEQVLLDRRGLPIRYRVSGRAYMGGKVEERYSLEDGLARWRTTAASGESRAAAPHLYVPADGTPAWQAIAVRALLRHGGRLPALPGGELALRGLMHRQLEREGQQLQAQLYAIDGVETEPLYVWIDAEQELLAVVFGWSTLIREGWEQEAERLRADQRAADTAQLARLRTQLGHQYGAPLAIRGARLFDSLSGRSIEETTVIVYERRVAAVYEGTVDVAGAEVLHAGGMTLLPGLFDMHDHTDGWRNLLQIAGGVTSVRDLANSNEALLQLVERTEAGELIGPRIFRAGFIDQQGPYSGPAGIVAGSLEEALAGVEWYAQHAYRQIKLYSSIDPSWVEPLARAAHARRMRLSGHIPAHMSAEQAVRAGYDEIQHINMVFLNFVAGPGDDTRTPVRFLAVAERAGDLDLDSPAVGRFIELLVERDVVVDPTVTIFEDMFTNRLGEPSPAYAEVFERLPIALQRRLLGETLPITEQNAAIYRRSFQALLRMIEKLYAAGVPLVAGTDDLAGFTLHRELEHYVGAGIPAPRVLQIATIDAARQVEADQRLGSVTPGKRADLILVDGRPDRNIGDIRRVVWVMKDGVGYDPAELYRAVGIHPHPRVRPLRAPGHE